MDQESQPSNPPSSGRLWPQPLIPKIIQRMKFTSDEDSRLLELCERAGPWKDWSQISNELGNRTPRQCRDRYKHYLNPELRTEEWTPEEDALLEAKVGAYGTRWNRIALFFHNRSEMALRNRWLFMSRHKVKDETTAALTREKRHLPIVLPILNDPALTQKPEKKDPAAKVEVWWPQKPVMELKDFWRPLKQ
jgi:hypothetical protein